MSKVLIAYYSLFGITDKAARALSEVNGGTLMRLIPEKEYSLDYNTASKEIRSEIARGYCPKLKVGNETIAGYGVIFIGSPNWFKTFAPPVLSFLRNHDFTGKTVVPFCTHGGGGLGEMEKNIARECPRSKVIPGLAIAGDFTREQITSWLESLHLSP